MRNLKALLRLLGAVSLTTVATTEVVACNKTTLSTFEADYNPAVSATFRWWTKLTIEKEELGAGYEVNWIDETLGQIVCLIVNDDGISKIDKFLNVTPTTRPIISVKSLSKIKLFASKTIVAPKGKDKLYVVDKIEIIE